MSSALETPAISAAVLRSCEFRGRSVPHSIGGSERISFGMSMVIRLSIQGLEKTFRLRVSIHFLQHKLPVVPGFFIQVPALFDHFFQEISVNLSQQPFQRFHIPEVQNTFSDEKWMAPHIYFSKVAVPEIFCQVFREAVIHVLFSFRRRCFRKDQSKRITFLHPPPRKDVGIGNCLWIFWTLSEGLHQRFHPKGFLLKSVRLIRPSSSSARLGNHVFIINDDPHRCARRKIEIFDYLKDVFNFGLNFHGSSLG